MRILIFNNTQNIKDFQSNLNNTHQNQIKEPAGYEYKIFIL